MPYTAAVRTQASMLPALQKHRKPHDLQIG
jgi:hypothetical protein